MTKRTSWKWVGSVALLCALAAPALAQDQGVAVKQDDIKAEPFKDAATVGAIKKGEAVSILKKQGGWLKIAAAKRTGWVRILSVRKGASGGSATSEIAGVAGVATGRAGTGQVVSTTGVRGLGEAELKAAKFSEEELKKAEAAAITAEKAKQFAQKGGLVARTVNWLPVPTTTATQGR